MYILGDGLRAIGFVSQQQHIDPLVAIVEGLGHPEVLNVFKG